MDTVRNPVAIVTALVSSIVPFTCLTAPICDVVALPWRYIGAPF